MQIGLPLESRTLTDESGLLRFGGATLRESRSIAVSGCIMLFDSSNAPHLLDGVRR